MEESRDKVSLLRKTGVMRNMAVHDRYKAVYWIFFLLGMGTLLPWNFFITATDYFNYKLRNTSFDSCSESLNTSDFSNGSCIAVSTPLQQSFENYLSVAAMAPQVILMFINAVLTKHTPLRPRMLISLCIMALSFVGTVMMVKLNTDNWQKTFFDITLVVVVIINSASSFVQGGLFGLSSIFPAKYPQAVMMGQGLGGIFAAISNILAILGGSSPIGSAFGYFMCATIMICLCVVLYLLLYSLPFARHYLALSVAAPVPPAVNSSSDDYGSCSSPEEDEIPPEADDVQITDSGPGDDESGAAIPRVFKKIYPQCITVFATFAVTLSCFPAVASKIQSQSLDQNTAWASEYFTPVCCFLFFNIGDTLGRLLAGVCQLFGRRNPFLPLAALLRIGFIPLFLYCKTAERKHLDVVFRSDVYFIVFIWLFALSNGYLSTLAMMYGPSRVSARDAELAGAILSFFLTLGLGAGSALTFLTTALI